MQDFLKQLNASMENLGHAEHDCEPHVHITIKQLEDMAKKARIYGCAIGFTMGLVAGQFITLATAIVLRLFFK